MMSPHQIQEILSTFPYSDPLTENQITQQIIVPCLQKLSMRNAYKFKDLQFTGGSEEEGTDIEYYEVIGPDNVRHYTGIQVKKANLDVGAATGLINQGTRAFGKEIFHPSDGRAYRIHRWIVATTGSISPPAKRQIRKELEWHGKPISFWDGVRLGEFILDNFYSEFVNILKVPPRIAGQSSGMTTWWDPDDPPVLAEDITPSEWTSVDTYNGAPPIASGIYISIRPSGDSMPPVRCALRSSIDEIIVDSFLSGNTPFPLKLDPEQTEIEVKLIEGNRAINILARGYLEFR